MRITFVLPYAGLAGGIRVVAIYAERLRRRGHEVFVVSTPKRQVRLRGKVKPLLLGRGWPAVDRVPSHFDGVDVPHRVIERWRPVADSDVPDADVVVATWWETAEWVAALSPNKGAKAYFIQHHEIHEGQPKDRVEATWRLPMHKITISKWLIELARDRYGDERASLVPNSVDMAQLRARVRGKQTRPTVGLLYSRAAWKGCDISFRAIEVARRAVPNLQVVAFGAQHPNERMPLPARTEYSFRPAQNKIKDIYAKCDVWLCGARREGFHLPLLEAMACRCPGVSTRAGGPNDIIDDGLNGFLVDVEDSDALAERLIHVLTLPESQWQAMSDAAYATARQYSWDDATDLFEQALQKAIERAKSGEIAGGPLSLQVAQ